MRGLHFAKDYHLQQVKPGTHYFTTFYLVSSFVIETLESFAQHRPVAWHPLIFTKVPRLRFWWSVELYARGTRQVS